MRTWSRHRLSFKIFREAFHCLPNEEAAEMFWALDVGGGTNMAQFKCMREITDNYGIIPDRQGAGPLELTPE